MTLTYVAKCGCGWQSRLTNDHVDAEHEWELHLLRSKP